MADNRELINALLANVKQPGPDGLSNALAGKGGFWDTYIRPMGSEALAKQQPNWVGRNILANPDLQSMLMAANFVGPKVRTWYHGTADKNFAGFRPEGGGGSRNAGGQGATFLTPFRSEAESSYGGSAGKVIAATSSHEKPFVWDLEDIPGTLNRARAILPDLQVSGDAIKTTAQQTQFFDALRRAGYDAVETRSASGPAELAVLDTSKLREAP